MGMLMYKHELNKELVDDFLQLMQAVVDRAATKDEPFAMDYKGLKQRVKLVKELQDMKPAIKQTRPTAAAVRFRGRLACSLCVLRCGVSERHSVSAVWWSLLIDVCYCG